MQETTKNHLVNILKGMGIGMANVIPGVSGATIAIVTGVFEDLIYSIKSFDITAIKLLCSGRIKDFSQHVNLPFLLPLMIGILGAVVSLAKLLEFLFGHYPVYIWAYFFGLILASIYYVGKTVEKWTWINIALCLAGAGFAVALTFLNPAVENRNLIYVFICGVVAICSMILPGISGSFILILMGNYELIMFEGVTQMKLGLLIPFMAGCGIGLVAFSHVLSWVLKKVKNQTIATLTGFICGSLVTIWPWKETIYRLGENGMPLLKDGESVIFKYQPMLPESLNVTVILAILIMAAGIASIWLTETLAARSNKD